MLTDFPIQGILDHLVKRIVDIMPITAAGVTMIDADLDPRYVAASNGAALRFEKLQTELREGPCLAAYHTGEAIEVAGSAASRIGSRGSRPARWRPGWPRCSRFRCTTATCSLARWICTETRRGRCRPTR